jgi:hypothetical protein
MDPEAALRNAKANIGSNREEAAESLVAYFEWRLKGGFEPVAYLGRVNDEGETEPKNGDERAIDLLLALGRVADTLSEAMFFKPGK